MLPLTGTSERLMSDDSEKRIENDLKVSGCGSMQGTNPALPQSGSMFVKTPTMNINFTCLYKRISFFSYIYLLKW